MIRLPRADGSLEPYELGRYSAVEPVSGTPKTRRVYAAAHVVADPLGDPVGTGAIDWDATLAFRRHLWSLGFGVAEAMDTAQRGMGLQIDSVKALIDRSLTEAAAEGGTVACGISTDELTASEHPLDVIVGAYLDQLSYVEDRGGAVVMMASRALAASARGPGDYADVYDRVLSQARQPVLIHWLGPMFDPALAGYWGSEDPHQAMESLLEIVEANHTRIDGVKISMLDEELEVEFRRRLPGGVRCYTGDDFNFPTLIAGDGEHHSDALLGIFDGIATVAITAFHALDAGDRQAYDRLLEPTVPLSRHVFEAPTFHYKTGLVFLAYLNGHQDHFHMIGGQESARSVIHLAGIVRLADRAGLFADPDDVERRLRPVMALAGVEQG